MRCESGEQTAQRRANDAHKRQLKANAKEENIVMRIVNSARVMGARSVVKSIRRERLSHLLRDAPSLVFDGAKDMRMRAGNI